MVFPRLVENAGVPTSAQLPITLVKTCSPEVLVPILPLFLESHKYKLAKGSLLLKKSELNVIL